MRYILGLVLSMVVYAGEITPRSLKKRLWKMLFYEQAMQV